MMPFGEHSLDKLTVRPFVVVANLLTSQGCRKYILFWGYMGTMEKKVETIGIIGIVEGFMLGIRLG